MSTEYSLPIELLVREYYQGHIPMEEYRRRRKAIIDQMEQEYNGVECQTEPEYRLKREEGV